MNQKAQHPGDFSNRFESALARLQVRVETACAAEREWPQQAAAAIRAALAFAAAYPEEARTLTSDALAGGRPGYARYDRMLDHFAERLLPGRELSPDGERLPEITEKAMAGGLASLIAQRLDLDRQAELPTIAEEAIQFVLTPYLGAERARRVAAETEMA